jgi:hypothetical protein
VAKPERSKQNNKKNQRSRVQGPESAVRFGFDEDNRPLCPIRDVPYVEALYSYNFRNGEYEDRSMRARSSRKERLMARYNPRVNEDSE